MCFLYSVSVCYDEPKSSLNTLSSICKPAVLQSLFTLAKRSQICKATWIMSYPGCRISYSDIEWRLCFLLVLNPHARTHDKYSARRAITSLQNVRNQTFFVRFYTTNQRVLKASLLTCLVQACQSYGELQPTQHARNQIKN